MAQNARPMRVLILKILGLTALCAGLGMTFAAYFHPALRVELANFWAMCVAALR
jgi:hypothetical protein